MSRKDNLIKSKSIYTLRSKHTIVPNGTIFENDHVTIVPNDGIYNEDMPLFSDSNFKFRIGNDSKGKRKHSRGGFVNVNGGEENVWTLLNLPKTQKSTDGTITLKPNYSSIKDFAYYGSAVELLRATLNDVIFRYPGGLYYYKTGMAPKIYTDAGFGEKYYYLVSNEFNIDFWTPIGCSTDGIDNPLRVLGASYMHYVDENGNPIALNTCITGNCPDSVIGRVSFKNLNVRNSDADDAVLVLRASDGNSSGGESSLLYCLKITAMTINNGHTSLLQNKSVVFVGETSKHVMLTATVVTNGNGVATACVPAHENGIWNGNASPNDIRWWTAYCVENNNTYYNTNGTRSVDDNELEDTIVIKSNNYFLNFPFIVWVSYCGTKTPIEGASVKYYFVAQNGRGVLVKTTTTNSNGLAYFNEVDYTPEIQQMFSEQPANWYAEVIYNGETVQTNTLSVTSSTQGYACFYAEEPNIAFLSCNITGILNTNENVGPGNVAIINFYEGSNSNRYPINGVTDENGRFAVTEEMFHRRYPNVNPTKANGQITYNGETRQSNDVYILESSSNPQNYNLTVYFKGQSTGNTKTLLCDVEFVGSSNGPVSGVDVTFTVRTDKSQLTFTAVSGSNDYGVAAVDIPSDIWHGNGSVNELVLDGNKWTVSCVYEGCRYNGILGELSIKEGQYRNIIQIEKVSKWPWIIIRANDGTRMLPGVMCTVCASTKNCGNYWYYINGITDSSGQFIASNNISDWHHFVGTPTATTDEFMVWKANALYHGEGPDNPMNECSVLPNQTAYTFVFDNDNNLPPVSYDCGKGMNDSNSFVVYMDGEGNRLLLTANPEPASTNGRRVIIEPKKEFFDEFWESIDDFEKVLLNRNSKPIYKAVLETPYVENGKHIFDYRSYVWPTINGYVPDTSSSLFKGYMEKLMEIAEYYDEFDSDNLWRIMTHDSIKNLDKSGIVYSDSESLDLSRMEAMIRIHGRLFDDIIRYANGIKYVNTITYDEKNNLPDYFLSDNVEIGGFDVKSINEFQKFDTSSSREASIITSDNVFSWAMYSGLTTFDCNGEFMKRLSISEDYILSTKGTRRGIEYILGMFGYRYRLPDGKDYAGNDICIGDYKITEYVRVAHKFPKYMDLSVLRLFGNYSHKDTPNENLMEGFPLNIVIPPGSEDDYDYYTIPWVNNGEKYVNDIYFQEKGGWGRIRKKNINLDITTADYIEEDSGVTLYSETEPYMVYVNDLEELTSMSNNSIYEGMICYVTDISGLYSNYKMESDYNNSIIIGNETAQTQQQQQYDRGSSTDPSMIGYQSVTLRDYSHYFVLVNPVLSTHIGYVRNELYSCYGWRNILLREFKDGPRTRDGLRVLYLESLSLDTKGNNPHCGFGNYDDGGSYIEKLNRIFGALIENGEFDNIKDNPDYASTFEELCSVGFDIRELIEDNEKCYYFSDGESQIMDRAATTTGPVNVSSNSVDIHGNSCELVQIIMGDELPDTLDSEKYEKFENPENGPKTEESAAFSVVNVKNLKVTFYTGGNAHFEKYLQDVVFKYLKEMIPSTTILEFEFTSNCSGFSTHTVSEWDTHNSQGSIHGEIVGSDVSVSVEDDGANYLIENNESIVK